jgi:hypothetical protein
VYAVSSVYKHYTYASHPRQTDLVRPISTLWTRYPMRKEVTFLCPTLDIWTYYTGIFCTASHIIHGPDSLSDRHRNGNPLVVLHFHFFPPLLSSFVTTSSPVAKMERIKCDLAGTRNAARCSARRAAFTRSALRNAAVLYAGMSIAKRVQWPCTATSTLVQSAKVSSS